LVALFYCILSITGVFAFPVIQDVYTLNFYHDELTGGILWSIVDYSLALFPVVVLTSSYVIVAITLTNNIRALISRCLSLDQSSDIYFNESEALLRDDGSDDEPPIMNDIHSEDFQSHAQDYAPTLRTSAGRSSPLSRIRYHEIWKTILKYFVPLFIVLIPTLISFFTDNVLFLASITGSYPGVGVQFMIPAMLIIGARRKLKEQSLVDSDLPDRVTSDFGSPFSHWIWPPLIICWAVAAIVIVTINFIHQMIDNQ